MTQTATILAPDATPRPQADAAALVLQPADQHADRRAVECFWTDNFAPDSRRFSCYFNNPAEPGSIWLLRSADRAVVGTAGLHACPMVIDGQVHRKGHAVNLAIDGGYRTAGPAIQLQRAVLDGARRRGLSLVCGVTERAAAVQKRAGYTPLGSLELWARLLRTETRLERHLRSRLLAKCLAPAADFALWAVSAEARRSLPRGWSVETPDRFDVRFDRLWERAASQFAIATVRSARFLEWRFRDCCDDAYQTLCLCDAAGELAGYVIYRRQKATVELADLLCASPERLELLLVTALRHLRRLRPAVEVVYVPCFGNALLPAALRRAGFLRRPEQKQFLVWANADQVAASSLCDPQRWYVTAADML